MHILAKQGSAWEKLKTVHPRCIYMQAVAHYNIVKDAMAVWMKPCCHSLLLSLA